MGRLLFEDAFETLSAAKPAHQLDTRRRLLFDDALVLVEKYNENHDERGRFASGPGGGAIGDVAQRLFSSTHEPSVTASHILAESSPDAAARVAETEARLSRGVATDAPVEQGGFKNPDGTYTAEREAVHDRILNAIFTDQAVRDATPAEGEKPLVTFLGGRGGSGKSWFTNPAGPIDPSKALLLNSDHIKEMLPEYQGWNAPLLHEESSDILAHAEDLARRSGLNVIVDGTLRSEGSAAQRLAIYKAAGYDAEGYYMHTSPQEAARRGMARFMRGGPDGRYVKVDYILQSTTNERTFDSLKPSFRKWQIYDNNTPGSGPKFVAEGGG